MGYTVISMDDLAVQGKEVAVHAKIVQMEPAPHLQSIIIPYGVGHGWIWMHISATNLTLKCTV